MRIPIAKYGIRELVVTALLFGGAAVVALLVFEPPVSIGLSVVAFAGLVFVVSFFRDPEREVPSDPALVVSPADGTVADIVEVPSHPFMKGPAHRIGIFLSVFNVHVNRAPVTGRAAWLVYKSGGFRDARDPAASEDNEAQDIGLTVENSDGESFPVLVRQIAGLIARRIVCPVDEGTRLERGQRFGMIKFGSRTEIFLPVDKTASIEVKVGDKVRGACDVVARLKVGVGAAAESDVERSRAP